MGLVCYIPAEIKFKNKRIDNIFVNPYFYGFILLIFVFILYNIYELNLQILYNK